MRTLPNILVTGTPTVGKTTTCTQLISLAADLPRSEAEGRPLTLRHLSVNQLVKDKGCHEGWDEEMKCWIVDEQAVGDEVERVLGEGRDGHGEESGERGGWLIDWHVCDLFPERWVDLVVVLRCGRTDVMWDRLKARDYPEAKLQENLDAEIFGVLLEEAREAFDENVVIELKSETVEDVEENCERILQWIQTWREHQGKKVLQKRGGGGGGGQEDG